MVALTVIALWLAICACFAVSAAIIGMPPQTIVHTVVMASFNFAAIMSAISVAVMLGVRPKHEAGEPHGRFPHGTSR
jgi:hypothetical protein